VFERESITLRAALDPSDPPGISKVRGQRVDRKTTLFVQQRLVLLEHFCDPNKPRLLVSQARSIPRKT
jgi:hypothetical protein